MREGAVVFIDALGFKGIWDPKAPGESRAERSERVLAKLQRMSTRAMGAAARVNGASPKDPSSGKPYFETHAAFVSDTVVLGCSFNGKRGEQPPTRDPLVNTVINVLYPVRDVLLAGLEEDPKLAYRGCIAIGEFEFDTTGRFFVGPAIDDAASHERAAEGAFIWMTPSAVEKYTSLKGGPVASAGVWVRYLLPVKGSCFRRRRETLVFNPLSLVSSPNQFEVNLLSTFDASRKAVRRKRENTKNFLVVAKKVAAENLLAAGE